MKLQYVALWFDTRRGAFRVNVVLDPSKEDPETLSEFYSLNGRKKIRYLRVDKICEKEKIAPWGLGMKG